ncbi:MAG: universal stress protein [Deltaproteobacteria bacterium]|nr:universal stress protein [Deltaproteobacteria bacterium]
MKIQKILAPTDLSELSRLGLEYALDLAKGLNAEVTVFHVAEPVELAKYKAHSIQELVERHQEALARFLAENFGELLQAVKVHQKVEIGTPDTSILEEAEKSGNDLIVMSTHGRTGLSHLLMGSVTEKVMRLAPCPVLSVHQPRKK